MTRQKPVGFIRQLSNSGSRADDRLQFIRCVGGREPQIHKLWTFAEDGITHKVHPFAHVDVSDFSGDCFHTYYMTEERHRVTMFGQISINVSVEWLGVPIPFYDTSGVPWIDNILVPELRWGDGNSYQVWASESCSRPHFGGSDDSLDGWLDEQWI